MAQKIQIRRDTAANWTSADPTLAQGEWGLETDTKKLKLGDGATAWASLAYVSFTAADISDFAESVDDRVAALVTAGGSLIISYNDAGNALSISDGWTYIKLASDFTTASAAAVDVTAFNFTPAASKTYVMEGELLVQTATATEGPRPGFSWATGLSDGVGWANCPNSASAEAIHRVPSGTEVVASSTGLPLTGTSYPAKIGATFITGASPSGNIQVRLRAETGAANVTMKAGSWLRYRTI